MSRKVHVKPTDIKNNQSLRTAVIVSLIAGLTLILLSTAVFSLAATTRSLSTDAERLHTTDEALRAATTARAQLALGLHATRVDSRVGSDSSSAVSGSVAEATLAMEGFSQSIALLEDQELSDGAETFLSFAEAGLDSIRVATSEGDRERIDADLDVSFSATIDQLAGERDRLLTSVADADRRMGTLGNLASFVVAFLLPTSAIFIYRQLARRPRRQVELEHELQMQRRIDKERSESLRLGLEYLDQQIESGDTGAILAEAERMSTINALVHGQHTYDVARLSLNETVGTIAQSIGDSITWESSTGDLAALVDPAALRIAVSTLVDSARGRGASRLHLSGLDAPASAKVEVLSDAPSLSPLEARGVFLEATELTAASTQQQRQLVLARTLLEGMGARIAYHPSETHEKFEITIPRAARSVAPTPRVAQ